MSQSAADDVFTCITCSVAFLSAPEQREHFHSDFHRAQQFGEILTMEYHDDQVIVTYKTRASSERAMRAGGSIPDVGQAHLAWVETPIAPTTVDVDENAERENWKR